MHSRLESSEHLAKHRWDKRHLGGMAVVRSKDATTRMIVEGAKQNAKTAAARAEAQQRLNAERLATERATIEAKASAKRERRRLEDEAGALDAERQSIEERARLEDEQRKMSTSGTRESPTSSYAVGDVEWPAYYGISHETELPVEVRGRVRKLALASRATKDGKERTKREEMELLTVCDAPVAASEIAAYLAREMPATFAWGSPIGSGTRVAYRATREDALAGTLMYVVSALGPTGKPTAEPVKDTPASLLAQLYVPGAPLDATTLVAVIARRTACVAKTARFAETRSYAMFERWLGAALETHDDATLAYVIAVLGDTDVPAATLKACRASGSESCEEDLLEIARQVRVERWWGLP